MKVLDIYEYHLSDHLEALLESKHVVSIKIMDDINTPILKIDDVVHFIMSDKINIKDFVLYKNYDKYFIRRVLKITKKGVYVAGDNERKYHLINETDVVARAIGRERKTKYISFTLKPKRNLYAIRKTRINYFRLKNRITDYDEEVNAITLKNLKHNIKKYHNDDNKKIKEDLEVSDDIKMFINPNEYEIPTLDDFEDLNDLEVKEEDLPSIEEDIKRYEEMGLDDESEDSSDEEE